VTTPAEMLDRIAGAWREWLVAIEDLPDDRVDEPGVCGHWSVKDLVPHMALWDLQAVEDIDRHLAGLPGRRNDWQGMNDDSARISRPGLYRLQLVEMHAAHRRLIEAVRDLDDHMDPEMIAVDTWDHYPEHTAQVRAWRAASGLG
jgi:hypothetical protein